MADNRIIAMRWVTFNKMYIALLVAALMSALVVPKRVTDQGRAQAQALFAPVSYPVRVVAGGVYRRMNPAPLDVENPTGKPRTYQQVIDENRDLRMQVARMTERLRQLEELNADREAMGALRELCRPMKVDGADVANDRKSLSLKGDVKGLRPGMAVLYKGGLAGKIDRVGWSGGAQVQLVTDRGFKILAKFGRLEYVGDETKFRIVSEQKVLLEGNGSKGMVSRGEGDGMVVRNLSQKDLEEMGVQTGDWALIADDEYGPAAQGYRIGQVQVVKPAKAAKFVELGVLPQVDPSKLQEVMVLTR